MSGGVLLLGDLAERILNVPLLRSAALAAEPIKIGILDPLSSPYKTSSIHDVHGANVAVDLFNKRGGVLGRPVTIIEADDASSPDAALKAATKFVQDDRVDVLMAYSTDGGKTFENIKISEKPFLPEPTVFFGDYNDISAINGIIRPIWTEQDGVRLKVKTAIVNVKK